MAKVWNRGRFRLRQFDNYLKLNHDSPRAIQTTIKMHCSDNGLDPSRDHSWSIFTKTFEFFFNVRRDTPFLAGSKRSARSDVLLQFGGHAKLIEFVVFLDQFLNCLVCVIYSYMVSFFHLKADCNGGFSTFMNRKDVTLLPQYQSHNRMSHVGQVCVPFQALPMGFSYGRHFTTLALQRLLEQIGILEIIPENILDFSLPVGLVVQRSSGHHATALMLGFYPLTTRNVGFGFPYLLSVVLQFLFASFVGIYGEGRVGGWEQGIFFRGMGVDRGTGC